MVDLLGPHRADDGHVVGQGRQSGKKAADLLAALAVFLELTKRAARFERGPLELGELLALGE